MAQGDVVEGGRQVLAAVERALGLQVDTVRRGIAVLPTREGLYRYLALKNTPRLEENVLLELEGRLGDELDLDADAGTLLILPERIVAVEPLHAEAIDTGKW